jgi:hypothetical protein
MRPRSKHLCIRYHHFREHVRLGKITINKIPTRYQLGDIATKAQPEDLFVSQRESILQWDAEFATKEELMLPAHHLRACDISDDSESLCNDGGQRDDAYKPEPGTESVGGVILPALGILRGANGPLPKYPSHDSSRLLGENSHLSQEIISSDTEQCGDVEIRPNTMEALQYDQWIKVFKTGGKDRKKRIKLLKKLALKDVDANNESLVLKGKNTENSS